MKKTISLLLAITLSFLLVSCSAPDIRGSVTDTPEKTDAVPDTTATPEVTEAAPTETPSSESGFEMGSAVGGTYTNEFLNLSCTLDETWIFYDEDQLASMSGYVADAIGDEELSEALAESIDSGKVVYDMYASTPDGLTTINIVIQNVGVLYGTILDENSYIDMSLETFQSGMESAGMTNVTVEKATVDFAGASHAAITMSAEYAGMSLYETLVSVKQGNYMAVITFCSFGENTTTDMLSLFQAV